MDDIIVDTTKLTKLIISPNEVYEKPPYLMTIGTTKLFARGDFSVIKGKQKSRKSFVASLFAGVMLRGSLFHMYRAEKEGKVLYIDTEQSNYYVWLIANRMLNYMGYNDNFSVFALRKYNPYERVAFIEKILYEFPADFIIIDGIRDLVTDINDQNQATMIVTKIMKWTQELNIHILNIIHENKGDMNSRGHLGTEVQNKCETVITVNEDELDREKSVVKDTFTRAQGRFDDFTIEISDNAAVIIENEFQTRSLDF